MADRLADEAVVAALRAGDERSFADLVASWSPVMLRTAIALAGDRATAEELVRAVWLSLPERVVGYRPPPGLRSWLLGRLVERSGLAAEADATGAAVPAERFLPPEHPEWPGHWQVPPSVWPAMDDRRPARGVAGALRSALRGLSPTERVVVGLRDVAGCDVGDIGLLLGRPAEQVRGILNTGRARLRTGLEEHFATLAAPA